MNRRAASASHRRALEALALSPAAVDALGAYLDLLAAWSARVNLTGARTPEARVELLVAQVMPALPFLEAGPLLDVGSGNGSPGLVLACLRPELPVTLLEPRAKRWAFLREAARAAGRAEVRVLRERHDSYDGPPAHTVTLRAVQLPLAALAPLVEVGGRVLVFGKRPETEGPFAPEAVAGPPRSALHVLRRRSM